MEDFQSKTFMEQYQEKFLEVVDANAIRMKLEIDGVIPKKLSFDMDNTSPDEATKMLYLHLHARATSNDIHKLCDAMTKISGYGNMNKLGHKMKSDKDLPPYTTMSSGDIPQPPAGDKSPSQQPENLEFYSLTPSDVGLNKVLVLKPVWHSLAVNLGVPVDQVQAYRTDPLGGLLALQYWRDGQSGQSFPPTWRFLLKIIEETFGKKVAEDLEKKASKEPTWTEQKN